MQYMVIEIQKLDNKNKMFNKSPFFLIFNCQIIFYDIIIYRAIMKINSFY